jgi:hypothetical protein
MPPAAPIAAAAGDNGGPASVIPPKSSAIACGSMSGGGILGFGCIVLGCCKPAGPIGACAAVP